MQAATGSDGLSEGTLRANRSVPMELLMEDEPGIQYHRNLSTDWGKVNVRRGLRAR